jgi:hypothetical protein
LQLGNGKRHEKTPQKPVMPPEKTGHLDGALS